MIKIHEFNCEGRHRGYIVCDGYIYVYCPDCDEIHCVPLLPYHEDGWDIQNYPLDERSSSPNKHNKQYGPYLHPCVHSESKKCRNEETDCAWYIYPADGKVYFSNDWGDNPIRPISRWPKKFQQLVKALTAKTEKDR